MNFCGNLDLYFELKNFGEDPTFLIGKDNYAVYQIFDHLYHDVMNGITFDDCLSYDLDEEEKRRREEWKENTRKDNLRIAAETGLIINNEIVWKSDEFPHDIAPYFRIAKYPNSYLITFDRPDITQNELDSLEEFLLYNNASSVRIRNSGSAYGLFNVPFMKAYRSLLAMHSEYPQVHIEEYILEQRIQSGESLEKILKKR